MSVEETIQPSFTVLADTSRPTENVALAAGLAGPDDMHPPPTSPGSYANREVESGPRSLLEDEAARKDESQSQSLEQWTFSQRKANEDSVTQAKSLDGNPGDEAAVPAGGIINGYDAGADGEQERPAEQVDTSFGPDIAEPTYDSAAKESEPDIPSPANTPSPPPGISTVSPIKNTGRKAKSNTTPVSKSRTTEGFQPINRYSPHKSTNFGIPSPLKSKSMFARKPKSAVEQDSFAEDNVKKQVQPVEKFRKMLEHYGSGTSNGTRAEGDGLGGDENERVVPGWEEEAMRPVETMPADPGTADVDESESLSRQTAKSAVAGPNTPDPSPEGNDENASNPHTPPDRQSSPPSSPSPHSQRNGFNALIEEDSSLGMPSEVRFSQDDELESQHSTRSVNLVATQSLAARPAYLSSPPPSPAHEHLTEDAQQSHSTHETAKTTSTNSHPRSLATSAKGDGTQEATQLVTEDEMVFQRPASPPSIPGRRVLPTARARLAGRNVISQPADRSRMMASELVGPHTIAGPQAERANLESRNGPPVLEDTYIDPQTQRPESDDRTQSHPLSPRGDVEMRSPSPQSKETRQARSLEQSSPTGREDSGANDTSLQRSSAGPLQATFVDPTLTSLPPPPPKRPTPTKYGKQKAPVPSPIASPAPSPIAGPSRLPDYSPPPAERATATKSGRVSKRKRRESAASMSDSSSSSEDVDLFDESYRPAAKPVVLIKTKGKAKASNPSLKRVKNGSRSRSGSRGSSAAGSKDDVAHPNNTAVMPKDAEEDASPWVLACWSQRYYIGRIIAVELGQYVVQYEDGTSSSVKPDKVRRGILRIGDRIRDSSQKHGPEYTVQEQWEGGQRGVKIGSRRLALAKVSVLASVINADFQDRFVSPEELGFQIDMPPRPQKSTSTSITSTTQPPQRSTSTSSDVFAGKIFFVTSASATSAPYRVHQKDASTLITRHGGRFVEKWYDLFDLPSHGFGSTLASTSAPFLIQETSQASLTPKALVSLAKGIPCLSMAYIDDAIADPTVDWRSYLVESGFSERLQQHCSQVVNGTWGSIGWNAAMARAERRPFTGKRFLFLEPKAKKDIKRLILVCLHAMGAVAVDCVQSLASAKDVKGYDFVLLEDREKKIDLPDWLRNLDQTCNIPWLKQCLIMGASLKPGLVKDK